MSAKLSLSRSRVRASAAFALAATVAVGIAPGAAHASCASPVNAIESENCLPGTPQSVWDLPGGAIDTSIEGFATDISVNRGETIGFKVRTSAPSWRLDVYRLGYYQGNGARLVATVSPSVPLPQSQPSCLSNAATGLIDCGNWAVSATWAVPATATSGVYVGKLVTDTGRASHVVFIVRDDAGRSDILFQSSDTTWQAYNDWGGKNLYGCGGFDLSCRAYKVSYNRPFRTRQALNEPENWVFNAEYPLIRWLESNAYDVSYSTATDSDRRGALIRNHRIFISNNHDEYWSADQRAAVEAARDAGVNLAFFSANTMFWKVRREPSIDGSATPYRTMVCYKETHAGAKIDPLPSVWTGTWRDPRFSPPADGGRPENALTGTIFRINAPVHGALEVPAAAGRMRFWRNTELATLAPGTTATLAPGTLGGTEIDVDWDNGFRPAGLFGLTANAISVTGQFLLDHGSTYGAGSATHNVTLFRHASGALVWKAGTYHWAWGLDASHDRAEVGSTTDPRMQQATVNLFADMGVQPGSLRPGLVPATQSTDLGGPVSSVTSPLPGATVGAGAVTVTGTAFDVAGVVAAVEVSADGGVTWHPASGREAWSYTFPASPGVITVRTRAVDDSGNLEAPGAGVTFSVGTAGTCGGGCSLWSAATPAVPDSGPDSAVEVGVRFRADVNGFVNGIRFYKGVGNTGVHVGNLWTASGTRLATATFANETASGWQQVLFASPVPVTAGTAYVASYHAPNGHYAGDVGYFAGRSVDAPPLHAPAHSTSAPNGVYRYGATSGFPNATWNATNYWVDVLFSPVPASPLQSIAVAPASASVAVGATRAFTATGTYADATTRDVTAEATWTTSDPLVATIGPAGAATGVRPGAATISAGVGVVVGSAQLAVEAVPLAIATTELPGGTVGAPYAASLTATGGTTPYAWSALGALPPGVALSAAGVLSGTPTGAGIFAFTAEVRDASGASVARSLSIAVVAAPTSASLWAASTVPGNPDGGADAPVELGTRFRSDVPGWVTGIRFYKSPSNGGVHVGSLWSASGQRLASATFVAEAASGWQQVSFAVPVPIQASTYYVASYHCPSGHYAADGSYFASGGVDRAPLHAPAHGVAGANGVFSYGPAGTFPTQAWQATNYWVDVAFAAAPPPSLQSLAVAPSTAAIQEGGTRQFTATATYADASSVDVTASATWTSSSTSVATISAAGLATGVGAGSATVSAAFGGLAASGSLTVESAPLAITTAALPDATVGTPYSAALAASGGTPPYAWQITSGLPPGLSLGSGTGIVAGTPSSPGAYSFTTRLTDAAGTTASRTLSIVVGVQVAATSIWADSAAPANADTGPDSAVTLGVKFRSDVAGYVTGIRFYKSAGNTGTHVGSLWSSGGTRLAQATFAQETASGWQTVRFSAPVAITANTVYVASYHARVGHYAADANFFTGKGQDNPPLHALASGVSGVNGVHRYGSTPTFPRSGFKDTNYWVDVTFSPTGEPLKPQSIAVTPANPTLLVGASQQLKATATYANGTTADVTGSCAWASAESGVASVSAGGLVTAFNPGTVGVSASLGGVSGSTAVAVAAGTPPPDEGPGGPLLVITHRANPFTRYLAEILRAEGLNAYRAVDVARVTPAVLAAYDVAILGEFPLTAGHVDMLSDWVNAGGSLVAMRPDKQLAPLLGLADAGATLAEGYLLVNTASPPGAGIVAETIQFHGTADRYTAAGAAPIATLYSSASAATTSPAVTLRTVGLGRAAAFTYDLARSVVYTRQGNPAWSGQERDGATPIRSNDLYFGGAQADYVNRAKLHVPQADEQQRLFANLVGHVAAQPLPRLWYFPSGHKAVVVMTGDDHANAATISRMEDYLATSEPGCSLEDWECIRSTSYVYSWTGLSDAEVAAYQDLGFEVSVHVTTECANFTSFANLDSQYASQLAQFAASFPSAASPRTHRAHCIVWSDYDTQPKVELAHGIRLDTNYYHWPGSWIGANPGFMTGSGIPMRFATRTGELVDVFQAATQMTDESEQPFPSTADALLDGALGPLGFYGAFTANMHTDSISSPGSDAILQSARARSVPVVSAKQLLDWLDARDRSYFASMAWDGSTLAFEVFAETGARNLRAMVPVEAGGAVLERVTRNGTPVTFEVETVKGVLYAFVPATTGAYAATYR